VSDKQQQQAYRQCEAQLVYKYLIHVLPLSSLCGDRGCISWSFIATDLQLVKQASFNASISTATFYMHLC